MSRAQAANAAKQAQKFFKIAEQGNDKSDAQVTWYIEKKWVDVNVQDKLECNAAHYAVAKQRPDLVVWLVRHGIDINHRNKRGRTPLHTAAEKGRARIIDTLMEHGAAEALGIYDKEGNTPFHIAVCNCEVQAVRALLRHGADRLHPTQQGKAPLDIVGLGCRNLHSLGIVRSLLTSSGSSQQGDTAASDSGSMGSSVGSKPQPPSASGVMALKSLPSMSSDPSGSVLASALHSITSSMADQDPPGGQDASRWPDATGGQDTFKWQDATGGQATPASLKAFGTDASDKPENLVLAVHLVRKLLPMLSAAKQFTATPHLKASLSTVEPLINSLHRTLSRLHPPGDIDPHLKPILSTLVEMWRVVETASKPVTGLAKLKRSLSSHANAKVDSDLGRLDGELHVALGHLSEQLLQHNSVQVRSTPSPASSPSGSSVARSLTAPAPPKPTPPQVEMKMAATGGAIPGPPAAQGTHAVSAQAPPQVLAPQRTAVDVMVDMERVLSEVIALLQSQSDGRVLLLHGLVGVGKTAAARATFDRLRRGLSVGVLAQWMGLQPGMSTSELLARQRSLLWTLAGDTAPTSHTARTLEEGRASLQGLLRGRRVLLAVDGVSGSQLEELLPPDLITLLAPSSILMLTSRNPHAAASLQLPPGSSVLTYAVQPLSVELAVDLFCRRAFKTAWPTAQQSGVVNKAVEQCGGLPVAVEAMALACSKGDTDPHLFGSYGDGKANKLFRTLHEAVDRLSEEEGEALQDIARFFVGAEWGAVDAYCGGGVLAELERSGLVEREAAGTVGVALVVEAFCEAVQQELPGEARLMVEHEEDLDGAMVEGVRGACFQSVDLELRAASQQRLDHRMLLLDGCMLHGRVEWAFQQLRWLSWRGPQMTRSTPAAHMERLVQAGLRVLLLEHLPFESINLLGLEGLRHLTVVDMPHLTSIEGLPRALQLTHINLNSCPLLTSLADLSLAPKLRHLALYSCPSLTPPPPSPTSPNNPHLLALNNAAFKRWRALQSLVVDGAWEATHISIAECPMLQRVVVRGLARVRLLAVLGCPAVREVSAEHCGSLAKLLGVAQLHELQVLRLEGVNSMEGFLDLSQMEALREVVLVGVGSLKVHPAPAKLKAVKSLRLS